MMIFSPDPKLQIVCPKYLTFSFIVNASSNQPGIIASDMECLESCKSWDIAEPDFDLVARLVA